MKKMKRGFSPLFVLAFIVWVFLLIFWIINSYERYEREIIESNKTSTVIQYNSNGEKINEYRIKGCMEHGMFDGKIYMKLESGEDIEISGDYTIIEKDK